MNFIMRRKSHNLFVGNHEIQGEVIDMPYIKIFLRINKIGFYNLYISFKKR